MEMTRYQQAVLRTVLKQRIENHTEAKKDAPGITHPAFNADISFSKQLLRDVDEASIEDEA